VGEWLARTGVEPGDAVGLDGKTLRGVQGAGVPGVHLVGAHTQQAGALLAQVRSEGKGQELAAAGQLLEQAPMSARRVTGDELLTQRRGVGGSSRAGATTCCRWRRTSRRCVMGSRRRFPLWSGESPDHSTPPTEPHWLARDLAERGGSLTVAVQREPEACHGRQEERQLWALCDPDINANLGWPHLAQICRLERRRSLVRQGRGVTAEHEVTYLVTSAGPALANAAVLLRTNRGHWGIENRTHYVRDVTFDEDRSQVRRGAAPQAFAACKNLVIALLRRRGWTNIAEALRSHTGRPPAQWPWSPQPESPAEKTVCRARDY